VFIRVKPCDVEASLIIARGTRMNTDKPSAIECGFDSARRNTV
jgi:hypothetical protein